MKDRRKTPRVLIRDVGLASKVKHILLSMLGSPASRQWDPVVDLSLGGICFVTTRELRVEETLLLTVRIDSRVTPIELEAVVVRAGKQDVRGRRRVGVKFTEYRGDALAMLKWFEQRYVEWTEEVKQKRGRKGKSSEGKSRSGQIATVADQYLRRIAVERPGALQGRTDQAD